MLKDGGAATPRKSETTDCDLYEDGITAENGILPARRHVEHQCAISAEV